MGLKGAGPELPRHSGARLAAVSALLLWKVRSRHKHFGEIDAKRWKAKALQIVPCPRYALGRLPPTCYWSSVPPPDRL